MYRTSGIVRIFDPIIHFTVPTPKMGKVVLPSPKITFPEAGEIVSKIPYL